MKRVCLDTDFLVALLGNRRDAVKIAEEYDSTGTKILTTSINAFEVYLGAFRPGNAERNIEQADELLNSINVLNLTWKVQENPAKFFLNCFVEEPPSV